MSIHGHSVGYRRGGTGETILLIHGLAGSSKTWDDVIPLLTPHADVIAVDLLGHGESAKPTGDYSLGAFASGLRDFLSILGVESVTIVGHSFGGGVAMQLAMAEVNRRLYLREVDATPSEDFEHVARRIRESCVEAIASWSS